MKPNTFLTSLAVLMAASAIADGQGIRQNPTKLRFHVVDATAQIAAAGVRILVGRAPYPTAVSCGMPQLSEDRCDWSHQDSTTIESDSQGNAELEIGRPSTYWIQTDPGEYVDPLTFEAAGYQIAPTKAESTNITIGVVRAGSISGTLAQTSGRAVSGFRVNAFFQRTQKDPFVLISHTEITDDNGLFRLWGLAPGRYILAFSSEVPDADHTISAVQLSPSGSTLNGRTDSFALAVGTELNTGTITIQSTAVRKLSGVVNGIPKGGGPAAITVSVPSLPVPLASFFTDLNGAFELPSVQEGTYVLAARWPAEQPERGTPGLAARGIADVTAARGQVALTLAPMGKVEGRFQRDGDCPSPAGVKFVSDTLWPYLTEPQISLSRDVFSASNIPQGDYRVQLKDATPCEITAMTIGTAGGSVQDLIPVTNNTNLVLSVRPRAGGLVMQCTDQSSRTSDDDARHPSQVVTTSCIAGALK